MRFSSEIDSGGEEKGRVQKYFKHFSEETGAVTGKI
jgi:hypothetical protein